MISSCIILFISLMLTPMTPALFDDHMLQLTLTRETARLSINWTSASQDLYSSRYKYLSYSVGWQDGHLPAFTTKSYALTVSYEDEMECTEPCQPSNKALMSSQRWRCTTYCPLMSLAFSPPQTGPSCIHPTPPSPPTTFSHS